jgi:hypothetical protein
MSDVSLRPTGRWEETGLGEQYPDRPQCDCSGPQHNSRGRWNIHSDQQDLGADRNDLRSDGQNVRNAGPVQSQRAAGNNGVPASASVNRNTQLTANTLANNAANNSKNAQTDQTTHKAWYHWIC